MKLQQKTLAAAILLSSTAAFAATPNVYTGESQTPLTVSGTINEVVACSFGGDSQTTNEPDEFGQLQGEQSSTQGLSFEFGQAGAQYVATATEQLSITCSDDASGNSYNVAMTVAGTTADYTARSSSIDIKINETAKTATLQASEDGTTFKNVSDINTNLDGNGGSVTYTFKASIDGDVGDVFGDVSAESAQNLFVKFDAEAPADTGA
ncbi:hypothetical protein [Spongiibacter marinus]|uniref:hypothetical protein n=1 Tax=Spongiibacter marinus TaxID=354246 RepID=UPI0003F4B60E|nr:hypothetical protein [Spongiibacter marinus]